MRPWIRIGSPAACGRPGAIRVRSASPGRIAGAGGHAVNGSRAIVGMQCSRFAGVRVSLSRSLPTTARRRPRMFTSLMDVPVVEKRRLEITSQLDLDRVLARALRFARLAQVGASGDDV